MNNNCCHVHLHGIDIHRLSIVIFPTPPRGLYTASYFSPEAANEVTANDELPDQGRTRRVQLMANPGNMLADQAHGHFRHPEIFAHASEMRSSIVMLAKWCCCAGQRAGRSGAVSHGGI